MITLKGLSRRCENLPRKFGYNLLMTIKHRHCKHSLRSNLFLLLVFTILTSCTEDDFMDYKLTDPETKLCLSGYVCPDSTYIVLSLSESYSTDFINSNGRITTISGNEATVVLFEDNAPFDTLVSQNRIIIDCEPYVENYYISRKIADMGKVYTIKAKYKEYDEVSAETYIPNATPIQSHETEIKEIGEEYRSINIDLLIQDLPGNNYYLLPKAVNSSSPNYYDYFLLVNNPLFENFKDLFSEQVGREIFFSDKLVQGKTFSVQYFHLLRESSFDYSATFSIFSISEDYYRYELSRHIKLNTQYDANSNPVTIYSNVEGGYGIFMGFSEAKYTVQFNVE